jgi:hypothetical protein
VIVSVLDPTQADGRQPEPLVDIDQIEPDESLLADLRKTRITTPLTRVLLVLIVLSVGFLGGALVDRWQRPSASSATSAQSLINAFRRGGRGAAGGSGATGTGAAAGAGGAASFFGGGAGGGATVGTVKLVDGKNVYVQDSAGDVIKVTTGPSTQVTISKPGSVGQLAPGSTVIVQGAASSDGTTIAATSITPSTGLGGRGGFGGGGAATAATGG